MTEAEIAWFAGLLEGEGCINFTNVNGVQVTIGMTDKDVVERILNVVGMGNIYITNRPPNKILYQWRVSHKDEVGYVLSLARPWVGERRGQKIDEALERVNRNRGVKHQIIHGTRNGYKAELWDNMAPCDECKRANADYQTWRMRRQNMTPKLLGLVGDSRSGKDSVAGVLVKKHSFKQVSLASTIRSILLDLNLLIRDNDGELHSMQGLWHDCYKNWDIVKSESLESVEAMIALGQSCRNRISEDVWINSVFPFGYDPVRDGRIVVSDVRQPNEVEFIHRHGGTLWKIERPELSNAKRGMDGLLKDVSFEETVINDGTLEDLEKKIDNIYGS